MMLFLIHQRDQYTWAELPGEMKSRGSSKRQLCSPGRSPDALSPGHLICKTKVTIYTLCAKAKR